LQGKQKAFEFYLSFQKKQEHQLIDSFSILAEFFCGFSVLFFLLVNEYTGILSQFLNKGVVTLLSLEKLGELSIGF